MIFNNIFTIKSFEFAIITINLVDDLKKRNKELTIANQLIRSGTAIGALIQEAQNAESTRDFIHKLSISQKECAETLYWIELLRHTNYLSEQEYNTIKPKCEELLKLIRSSIKSTKSNLRN